MTTLPTLYSFRRCPYAMRARMAVAVSGVEVELREVVLRDKPPEMLAASPKGTVPVLILPDGQVIDQSLDVMRWALARNDPQNWLAGDDLPLLQTFDGPFKSALDRYKYPHRYQLEDNRPYRMVCSEHLADLEARLAGSGTSGGSIGTAYLASDTPTLVDIAIFPFVRQFAATDQDWFDAQPLPKVQNWLTRLTGSALFESIMHKYPQWTAGGPGILFP